MAHQRIVLPSFAKINLHLRVIGRRKDGFHELCTIFQTVSLADDLILEPADKISLECNDSSIPSGNENLIVRAAELLRSRFGTKVGIRATLTKRIPVFGGLGGGSSNAAVALLGLRNLWQLEISDADLAAFARELGADVPYFLVGGTAVGTGTGADVIAINEFCHDKIVIVTPGEEVSTREIFEKLQAPSLTKEGSNRNLIVCRKWAENANIRQEPLRNELEPIVFRMFPEIERARDRLIELGASQAGMSGSGGSVYGFFENELTRQTALEALGSEADWRSFAAATISREHYREALSQVF